MAEISGSKVTNVVLVHGAFVDGSGWEGVYKILKNDGYLFLDKAKFPASFEG